MNHNLDNMARAIEARVNGRIAEQGRAWSPLEYRAQAQAIADDMVPAGWQWDLVEAIGELPRIVLMQFDPRATA